MVEDFLKSANTVAARVQKKKPIPPLKSPSRQRRVTGENSTATSNSEISTIDHEPSAGPSTEAEPQDSLALVPIETTRDPRLRTKKSAESHSAPAPKSQSEQISISSQQLKSNILMRVLKWSHKWIEVVKPLTKCKRSP